MVCLSRYRWEIERRESRRHRYVTTAYWRWIKHGQYTERIEFYNWNEEDQHERRWRALLTDYEQVPYIRRCPSPANLEWCPRMYYHRIHWQSNGNVAHPEWWIIQYLNSPRRMNGIDAAIFTVRFQIDFTECFFESIGLQTEREREVYRWAESFDDLTLKTTFVTTFSVWKSKSIVSASSKTLIKHSVITPSSSKLHRRYILAWQRAFDHLLELQRMRLIVTVMDLYGDIRRQRFVCHWIQWHAEDIQTVLDDWFNEDGKRVEDIRELFPGEIGIALDASVHRIRRHACRWRHCLAHIACLPRWFWCPWAMQRRSHPKQINLSFVLHWSSLTSAKWMVFRILASVRLDRSFATKAISSVSFCSAGPLLSSSSVSSRWVSNKDIFEFERERDRRRRRRS